MEAASATREYLWNINQEWIMYPCFVFALAVSVYFFYRRYRLWKVGQPENRSDHRGQRLSGVIKDAFLQLKVLRVKGIGIAHLGMYAGMVILLIATASIAAQVDLGLDFAHGYYYLIVIALGSDFAGLAFCLAIAFCIIRRIANKKLDTKPSDIVVLVLLLTVGVGGFAVEGLRIAGAGDPWRDWSPIGSLVALAFENLDANQIATAHRVLWWSHMALAFALIAYWTYSKLVHVLLIPSSIYHRSLKPASSLPFVDFEDDNLDTLGVGCLEDFTWKDLFDTQACIRCNRCQENCPAYLSGKPLSPKALMDDLGAHLEERGALILDMRAKKKGALTQEEQATRKPTDEQRDIMAKTLVGDTVKPDALWACTTCGSCMEQCPASLEHVPKIVKMRTYQVCTESVFPSELHSTFRNMETNGNPWGLGWETRSEWMGDCDLPLIDGNPNAEYLFWTGCAGAFDSRNQRVSRAFAQIMSRAEIDFAILGNKERCCGDAARRLGNEYLYYTLANENIETLKRYKFKKIVTTCPHCYNAFKVDYPQLGGCFEAVHHTELIKELIEQGRIAPRSLEPEMRSSITYQDSCYLGRYNGIYQAPRKILSSLHLDIVEMKKSQQDSLCCGAGGGRIWLDEQETQRVSTLRTAQALETSPEIVATACPYCLTMLSDGMSMRDAPTPVKDVAEIVLAHIG
ncbi:hypothetical protein C1878_00855 [Gordonibacter sp. 28C]|uniref:heterodisulfide reductase-related iron-sulfur binding cluster n=1 Tax=Gordonibacter sp. 28C TaxID=2078569 RepID=UPI000DF767BE|nr:heterodisulfide reductase-related iron-sulfur binding cluster [Gordonibacter sp. 28C]RDB64438.1 hypothetical protein C1878_00855 [Gordonibacter sp. 28C]